MEWNLGFITKENYKKHIKEYYKKINSLVEPTNLNDFNRNIIDPIKLTFSYFLIGEDKNDLIYFEQNRQVDKSINNHIGYFHQNIFNYINGWHVPSQGFDIVNDEKTVYVELKNKHNTMNSSSSQKTYINMLSKIIDKLEKDKKITCMLVEIIAKKSQNIPWEITLDGKKQLKENIRRVSIDKFYEYATGDKNAFKKLVSWLPITLKEIMLEDDENIVESKIVEELEKERSFFINLYNLAFDSYEGFDELKFVDDHILGDNFKT